MTVSTFGMEFCTTKWLAPSIDKPGVLQRPDDNLGGYRWDLVSVSFVAERVLGADFTNTFCYAVWVRRESPC